MWIPTRVRYVGAVNIDKALNALGRLDENAWYADDELKKELAGDRPTQSLFLYSIGPKEFSTIVSQRPLEQVDVPRMSAYDLIYEDIKDLFHLIENHYPEGGVFTRVQLARMGPGTKITPHRDATPILENCHRLHIPLITNDKLRFVVDGEEVKLEPGGLYELNNQVEHWVDNPKDAKSRIHLILDYLPPEHNLPESLGENFKFKIKADRTAKAKIYAKKNQHNVVAQITKNTKTSKPNDLPTVIVTSVVRGAHQNESHGGVYLVDMKNDSFEQVVDWNTCDIDFSGRGWDRGLRGICFIDDKIVIAGSDAIYFYDKNFNLLEAFNNPYLRHAHEMMIDGRFLYVTSTGFDAVLRFNLRKKAFDKGWQLFLNKEGSVRVRNFDPQQATAIGEVCTFHVNNAFFENGALFMSGRHMVDLIKVTDNMVISAAQIPRGTHNVSFYSKGVIYNDTESDQIVYSANYDYRAVDVPVFDESKLENNDLGDVRLARVGFGRGLCKYKQGTVLAGSSPSTVSLIDFKNHSIIKSINISKDVRNAIHGLEVWPF